MNCLAGHISYFEGRQEEAVRQYEKAAALVETDLTAPSMLTSCYTALGDEENSRRAARIVLERAARAIAQDRSNGYAIGVGVQALTTLRETERAKEWMDRAPLIDPDNLLMRYNFACTLATALGDPEAALDMLGQALGPERGWLARDLATDPDLASLRDDPRFQAILAKAEARLEG